MSPRSAASRSAASVQAERPREHSVYFDHERNFGLRFVARADGTLCPQFFGEMDGARPESAEAVRFIKSHLRLQCGSVDAVGTALTPQTVLPANQPIRVAFIYGDLERPVAMLTPAPHGAFGDTAEDAVRLGVPLLRLLSQDPAARGQWFAQSLRTVAPYQHTSILDLHTHFGGAMRPATILEVAMAYGVSYPAAFLRELGIDTASLAPAPRPGCVLLGGLAGEDKERFLEALSIPAFRVDNFVALEKIYRLRGPIVKHAPAFGAFLRELARDFQRSGVVYAELSISDIVQEPFLQEAHAHLPGIEEETGVALRFKAAMWRHSDPIYNQKFLDDALSVDSPYLVGVDFMGEETNSSRDFAPLIKQANAVRERRPHFAVQVHAGESTAHVENVEKAALAGATQIGHGIRGITPSALGAMQGCIVQFNLVSNLALANLQRMEHVGSLATRYLAAGQRMTFGTDGHGMYNTSPRSELDAALLIGLGAPALRAVRKSDEAYLETMRQGFARDMQRFQAREALAPAQAQSRFIYHANHWESESARAAAHTLALSDAAESLGMEVLPSSRSEAIAELRRRCGERTPVYVMLPGGGEWLRSSAAQQGRVAALLQDILASLDPAKTALLVGGSVLGADALIHAWARAQAPERRPLLLAVAPSNLPTQALDAGAQAVAFCGRSWAERNALVVDLCQTQGGWVVAVDGGKAALDTLQSVFNDEPLKARTWFYRHAEGEMADKLPSFSEQAFDDAHALRQTWGTRGFPLQTPRAQPAIVWPLFDRLPKKDLPPFCAHPLLEPFLRAYNVRIDPARLRQAGAVHPTPVQSKLVALIEAQAETYRPLVEHIPSGMSQRRMLLDFAETHPGFSVDPRNLAQFFTGMTDAHMLAWVEKRLLPGANVLQVAAKLAIWLDHFARRDLKHQEPVPAARSHSVGAKGHELTLRRERAASESAACARAGQFKDLSLQLPDTHAFAYSAREAAQDDAPNWRRDLAFVRGLADTEAAVHGGLPARQLLVLRGISGYGDYARQLQAEITSKVGENSAFIVSTDAHLTDLGRMAGEKIPWPKQRAEAHARNRLTLAALVAREAPYIIMAQMTKSPAETATYAVDLATKGGGYQAAFVMVGDLSYTAEKHYTRKHRDDFLDVANSQWGRPEVTIGSRNYPQVKAADLGSLSLAFNSPAPQGNQQDIQ